MFELLVLKSQVILRDLLLSLEAGPMQTEACPRLAAFVTPLLPINGIEKARINYSVSEGQDSETEQL
jgi:hypothetical protein